MRILVVTPIGCMRRSLENWMGEFGHKAYSAETLERAVELLEANPGVDVVITEWLLGEHTAYDLFKRANRLTRMADHEGQTAPLNFLILLTPVAQNPRLKDQLDTLRNLDHVVVLEKPIRRSMVQDRLLELATVRAESTMSARPNYASPPAQRLADQVGCEVQQTSPLPAETDALLQSLLSSVETLLVDIQRHQTSLRAMIAARSS